MLVPCEMMRDIAIMFYGNTGAEFLKLAGPSSGSMVDNKVVEGWKMENCKYIIFQNCVISNMHIKACDNIQIIGNLIQGDLKT